ncbi:MAG: phosphotransferase [Pseudomonadota bacterium]
MSAEARSRAARLSCWSGAVDPQPLKGGITNTNFVVEDRGERFVVRIGDDIPILGVLRFNELTAAKAAEAVGISPPIVHHEPGALVMRYVEGRTLAPEDIARRSMLERILPLIRLCHREIPKHLSGPVLMFWVFHVLRSYAHALEERGSRYRDQLPHLLAVADELERAVGPIEVVFGHNDLLAANFIDAGERLWLIDWDYAGFDSPHFDLANLASNNALTEDDEAWLLEGYFGRCDAGILKSHHAMKCASLLRETMWSMVSELTSTLDFDYAAYTNNYLGRFEAAHAAFKERRRRPG